MSILEESKEIRLSLPESQNILDSEKLSPNSVSSDSPVEALTVETYDEFAEPVEVLSRISSHAPNVELSKNITGTSMGRSHTWDPAYEVDFEPDDPGNP